MNALTGINNTALVLSSRFASVPFVDEMGSGVSGGFGVITYKGKIWKTKYQGTETVLRKQDGSNELRQSIEVVVVKAASVVAKIYYETGFVDGSTAPPDCWSTNGQTPDPASPKKQCATCAGCPMNAWGSRVTEAGKPGKACADSKRLAVVPMNDINNDLLGGPMLLRVPAASLREMKSFADKLQAMGFPSYSIAIRIGFAEVAHPQFTFGAIRALTDEEADDVMALRDDPRTARILSEAVEFVRHEGDPETAPLPESVFEQPPQPKAAAPATAAPTTAAAVVPPKVTKPRTVKPVAPAPAPVVAAPLPAHDPETGEIADEESEEDRELREMQEAVAKRMAENAQRKAAEAAKAAAPKATTVRTVAPVPVPAPVADEGEEEDAGEAPADFEKLMADMMR